MSAHLGPGYVISLIASVYITVFLMGVTFGRFRGTYYRFTPTSSTDHKFVHRGRSIAKVYVFEKYSSRSLQKCVL